MSRARIARRKKSPLEGTPHSLAVKRVGVKGFVKRFNEGDLGEREEHSQEWLCYPARHSTRKKEEGLPAGSRHYRRRYGARDCGAKRKPRLGG